MPEICATKQSDLDKLDVNAALNIPAMELPSFRIHVAVQKKVENKILLCTGGGIGDYITAEPSFRFAMRNFKNCEFYLLSQIPDLFRHLSFKQIFNEKREEKPKFDEYFTFRSMPDHEGVQSEFITQLWTNCVDYSSLNMFRFQLPPEDREIKLVPSARDLLAAEQVQNRDVAIHAGMTWQSRTFPESWWNAVLKAIIKAKGRPLLIGARSADDRGTVNVDVQGCLDLRGKLSVMESVAVLQKTKVLLTNDSAPLHMAASGDSWIGMISTARHPYYITHWRKGRWSWRQENLSRGGLWQTYSVCPNQVKQVNISVCDPEELLSWLPEPEYCAEWAMEKIDGLHKSNCR